MAIFVTIGSHIKRLARFNPRSKGPQRVFSQRFLSGKKTWRRIHDELDVAPHIQIIVSKIYRTGNLNV